VTEALIEQDEHLVITAWSDDAERLFGWTAQEALGLPTKHLVPERNRARHDRALRSLLNAERSSSITLTITALHRNGREFKVETTATVADHQETGRRIRVVVRTRQEVVEARLEEAEQTFRELIDRLDDGYFEVDLGGVFKSVNAAYCRMTGRTEEELLGSSFKSVFQDEEKVKATVAAYARVYETGEPLKAFEHTITRKDGTRRIVEDTISLKRDVSGKPVGFIGIRRDCTERHLAAEKLRLSEERYRAVLERIEDGYFEIELSRKGRYEYVNDAFCRTTGYSREELIGQSYEKFFDSETVALLYKNYHHVYRTGEPLKALEYSLVAKDGTKRFVEESVSLRKDASGAVVGFMGIRRDATARKLVAQELAAAKESAEAASMAKSEFLANMSHEIRTPMNGIIGMTELALDTELTPYQVECLSTVRSSAESLLTILNDILDFSKIESRKLDLEQVPFSLDTVIEETVKPLAVRAHQQGLEFITDVPPEIHTSLVGDPFRLRQVLTNLLVNAIKFTEHGYVMLTVREEAIRDRRVALRFSVADTGIGIPRDKQDTIFEAFSQADGSTTRRFGGTGLGLAISSTLVRMMGGHIVVHSSPNEGSTFEFSIGFNLTSDQTMPPHAMRLRKIRTLIVDDNTVNRSIFESQLLRWGMQPVTVAGGQEAIEALTIAHRQGMPFKLMLLDAQMPGVDGFEVATKVARRPELAGITIMMLTSGGRYGDSARCRELGISTYLSKPVKQADLFDAICHALDGTTDKTPKRVAAPIVPTDQIRRMKVLLAEDNIVNQRVAVGLLQRRGHDVTVVSTGVEALDALKTGRFDVVLMDVQMPVMGGFEATAAIRRAEEETGQHLRIVAMTAHAMAGDRERCLAAGMDGYLAKPIDPAVLFAAVEKGAVGDISSAA
jgi:two-component system, sensor histidine kinase and response regulator